HEYRAEASIMMAAYSCFQNWNPIQFCLLEERMPTATTPMQNPFYTYTDPVYTSVNPAAAIIFHRYDVPEAKDVYYQPYDKAKAMNLVTSCINPGESESVSTISPYAKVGTVFTDLIDNPEVRKESERTRLISKAANREKQSNEIDWNNRAGTFKINTPFTNSATGTISGEAMDFTDSKMNINTEFATVTLNSVTKDNLAVSKRMLLTCVANARNTGFSMASVGQIGKVGKAPILVEPVVGQIEIKTRPEDTIVVFALDSSGQRKASVPVTKATNGYSSFRVDGTYKSVHYEIVRGGENQVNVEINNQTGRVNVSGTVNSQNPQDKNVTILAALTADIGSITDENAASKAITIAQLKTDNLGSFVYDFTMPPNAEGGSYTVVVLFEGSQTQIKKEFIYVKTLDPNALKITVDNVTKEIRVVGKSDKIEKRVTMRVFDPMYSLPDTTASNIGKYTCAINQGMTDNNGGFDMRFKLGPYAGSGTYSVKVAVGNNDIRTDTFEYKGMREGVVSVDSALNTKCVVNTGVYKKPLDMDAVTTIDNTSEYFIKLRTNNALLKECTASLIIATYRKGQMVDYKFENIIVPQMSSAEISKNLATDKMQSGDKVKIFLWQPDESIASITDAIELDVS
ncbi:MAG: hypothetical protein RR957_05175, partial [Oscillospiraceae bacterium]